MAGSIAHFATAAALVTASAAVLAQQAVPQNYPVKPILLLTPFAPGAGPDLYMRPLSTKLGEQLGQTVVLDSKIGAGGALAVLQTAQAAPDGYTMTVVTNSNLIQPFVQPSIGYDAVAQLAHITRLNASSSLLVVPATSQIKRVEDLVALAKSSPGKLNYGSGGIGTPSHLASATLQFLTGIDTVHIPFKNSNDVVPSLLRGDIQYAFQVISFAAPFVRSGKLRVLATTAATRLRDFPDVPTMNELLRNDLFVQESWTGLAVPARTPVAIVRRLFAETVKAFADSAVQKGIEAGGVTVALSESPEQYTAYVRRENEKWREIVKLSGIKPE
jgi:tripartite-type tricarboxylate transporter receptor subunit TctC